MQRFDLGVGQVAGLGGGREHVEERNRTAQELERGGAALPARNSPASMAVLASRTNSKTAASASAVLRSSLRLSRNACDGLRGALGQCFVQLPSG